jgi:hypothetical protein
MKKRVRLYKAQEGGMPNADMFGYPGQQGSSAKVTDEELAQTIMNDVTNSEPRDRIIIKLVNVYGKDPMEAEQFVDQIIAYTNQQNEEEDTEEVDDSEEEISEVPVEEETVVEEEDVQPTGTQMSNQMLLEDDEEVDESDLYEGDLMQYGGYPMAQEGMETQIQMPDVSEYLPQDMGDYLGGTTNPYSGIAWDSPEETEDVSEDEEVFSDYTEPMLPEERYGGMPSKRSYVNSVLKLVKKQMGGDSAAPESAKYNDDNADPTGANVRKKSLDKFIGSVKNQSNMALAKQQAEQQYEQMMQQQQMMQQYPMAQQGGQQPDQNIYQGQDYENPMHHLALFSQATGDVFQDDQNKLVEAQFGGLFGRRRMRNMMQQGMPMIPGMPPITRMDVRKSGWLFNRPKEYSIEFGAFSPMPGMSPQGLPAGAYGYTTKIIKTPARRIKVEAVAATVNKEAVKEVSNNTPNSTATTKAAESAVTTTVPVSNETVFNNCFPNVMQNKQFGGSINNPFSDQYGNLQQFTGGGDEDFTQGDLDDVYSKDTANGDFPMAQWGGGIEALFPANILPRRYGRGYSQMRGVPYDPRTKAAMANFMPGPGARVNKIDVTKSNWLTGAPKKYTVTYGQTMTGPSNKPGLPNSGTNTPQSQMRQPVRNNFSNQQRTDIPDDLSLAAKMAINRGDRQTARNDRRLARNPQYANYANVPQVDDFTPEELRNKKIMSSLEPRLMPDGSIPAYKPTAKAAGPSLQYGGDLERFLPEAETGMQNPISYANNPAVANVTQNYFDKNNQAKPGDFTDIFADYAAANKKDASGGYEQETAVDYKAKKAPGSFDGEAMVNTINAGVQGVTGLINRAQDRKAEAKMADNLTADNLYASDPSKDRGDYDTNSGLYRQDEMGQKWNSRSKQYGGNIYQDGGMVEGDELDMTEEEIADFIANGGELEYL